MFPLQADFSLARAIEITSKPGFLSLHFTEGPAKCTSDMKTLAMATISLFLTSWPLLLKYWVQHVQHAKPQAAPFPWSFVVPVMLISLLAGFIMAIVSTMVPDENSMYRSWGRGVCVIVFCLDGFIVLWIASMASQFSRFGVN